MEEVWLALVIGNSRLHWGAFTGDRLIRTWEMAHLTAADLPPSGMQPPDLARLLPEVSLPNQPELWIASVVPDQTRIWATFPNTHRLSLEEVPIADLYPTLGIDRALALWGAISEMGAPVLVVDAGTGLTFTGASLPNRLVGGAILPGMGLQFRVLNQNTAGLPLTDLTDAALPDRWARETPGAIASGILYTLLAGIASFIQDWWQQFPESRVVVTGGDGDRLLSGMQQLFPELANQVTIDAHLILKGIRAIRDNHKKPL